MDRNRSRITARIAFAALVGALSSGIAAAQTTERVSIDSGGAQGNSNSWEDPSISADGRFVAYYSYATNLVAGDTNMAPDIFVHDRQAGTTERVSLSTAGTQGDGESRYHSISADGRYVAFGSSATNLVAGDTNAAGDVFVRDRQAGTTERVSVATGGTQGNSGSNRPSISADGRFVAFQSAATNLVAGDTNGQTDVFVHDRWNGTTELLSIDSNGVQGNSFSTAPSISGDGRLVAFDSAASNLVAGDTNARDDSFVRDRQLGTTERVSLGTAGTQGDGHSGLAEISADGRFVAYSSNATNLVAGDTNGTYDAFVRDRQGGTTERVSVDTSGVQGDLGSFSNSISADGQFVAFHSPATNLVAGDTNGATDAFVRDWQGGTTERVSVDTGGVQGDNGGSWPAISADGRFVAFSSSATNLVPGDTNGFSDIFVRDRGSGAPGTDICQAGTGSMIACPCSNPPANAPRGCDNSSATGGAQLISSGTASLSNDTLLFVTNGEKPTATSIVLQGSLAITNGIAFGQGVRCAGGTLKRLYVKAASGGSISAPGPGDPSVSARSSALNHPIAPGESRWYAVYYRDPIVLGGCPATSTFNITQTQLVLWGA